MKDDKSDTYYVGIEGAVDVRRQILESAKVVVHTIEMHNRIRDIQDEKLKLRARLAHNVHDIKEDLHKLQAMLPQREVRAPQPVKVSMPAPVMKKPADHRLEKIEAALNEIEERLKTL